MVLEKGQNLQTPFFNFCVSKGLKKLGIGTKFAIMIRWDEWEIDKTIYFEHKESCEMFR